MVRDPAEDCLRPRTRRLGKVNRGGLLRRVGDMYGVLKDVCLGTKDIDICILLGLLSGEMKTGWDGLMVGM